MDMPKLIGELIRLAPDRKTRERIVEAEQDAISFWFDMRAASVRKLLTGKADLPDASKAQAAAMIIDEACAACGKPPAYGKDILDRNDLYAFAEQVVAA